MSFLQPQKSKIFFGIFFIILMFFSVSSFASEFEQIVKKHFNVNTGDLLELKTDAGDVVINTWDKNELSVEILGNKKAKKRFEFSFNKTEFGIEIIGKRKRNGFFSWFNNIKLKYEITVPKNFDLKIKTAGGDLVLNNCEGKFDMKTSGGDIIVNSSEGELSLSTSGGDISIDNFDGDCNISTSGGDILMNYVDGDIIASSSGGDINIKSESGKINASTAGGDIDVNFKGINFGIYLTTSGGDISLQLPNSFNADVELKTSGGRVYNNFSNSSGQKVKKNKFIGNFNSGGKKVICKTSGGDITVSGK